jgi:DNA helicase-2/ATP-dependent DNA helicase PcrA
MNDETSLYVVGDPDQTIYTWRGANQNIILDLDKNFPSLETVILDKNYRSTQNILDCSNKLISFNKLRVKKDLIPIMNPVKTSMLFAVSQGMKKQIGFQKELLN